MADNPAPTRPHSTRSTLAALSLVVAVVAALVVFVSLRRPDRLPSPATAATAVGDSTCLSCHQDKGAFEETAHRRTSAYPSHETVAGSFRAGQNVLRTTNPALHFRMEEGTDGFRQTAVVGKGADTTSRGERIAIVVGSGRKGQTYLYWAGDRLFELPVSYWRSVDAWVNSPGRSYAEGQVNFDHPVGPRCLDCHATSIRSVRTLAAVNRYVPATAILGITCERCHGAGRVHVARERSPLRFVRRPGIVNIAKLNRARGMEACAQCHGGPAQQVIPGSSYVPGMRLADYLDSPPPGRDSTVDVHGNQVALLERSPCYQKSQMTCLTCHDVHRQQRDVAELSGRCLSCHTEQSCGLYPQRGHALRGRCVDCHMPLQRSDVIVSSLEGRQEQVRVRTHWIRVWPDSATR